MKRASVLLLLIFLTYASIAETKVANDPTRISVGARLLGMGKSFVGDADDISSIFLNPSGLASLNNWQLTSMQGKFINEVNYLNFAAATPSRFGNVGFAYVTSDLSFTSPVATTEVVDGIRIIPSTTEGASYKYNNSALLLSFGTDADQTPLPYINNIENLSFGGTFKLLMQTLEGPGITGGNANGYEMDLGVKYRPLENLSLGFTAQNVIPFSLGGKIHWGSNSDESLPSLFKLGASYMFLRNGHNLTANFDYDFTPLRPLPSLAHVGLEWSPVEMLALRIGFDQDYVGSSTGAALDVANNLTAGIGFTYQGFRFDYAYHQYYSIPDNDTSYFSLSYGIFKKPPLPKYKFTVSEPADKTITIQSAILISGEISGYKVRKLAVKDELLPVKPGPFSLSLPLKQTKNRFILAALDQAGEPIEIKNLRVLKLDSFSDVPENYWAARSISTLATLKVLTGYPDGTFKPEGNVTRAEFAAILIRLKDIEPLKATSAPFKDVKPNMWAADYILTSSKADYIKGYPDKTFKPNGKITRAEGVSVLSRFAYLDTSSPIVELPFSDIPGRHWAIKEINAAKNAGYLKFLEGKRFEPKKHLTRAEVAEMLMKTKPAEERTAELLDFEKGY